MAATLEGQALPLQFMYDDFIPVKRYSTTDTSQTVVFQSGCVPISPSGPMGFRCPAVCPSERCLFLDIYQGNAPFTASTLTLVGYNGDEYEVKMVALNSQQIAPRLYDISGEFFVVSVTSYGCS